MEKSIGFEIYKNNNIPLVIPQMGYGEGITSWK